MQPHELIDEALHAFESDPLYVVAIVESVVPASTRRVRERPVRERPVRQRLVWEQPVRPSPQYEFPVTVRFVEPTHVPSPEPTREERTERKEREAALRPKPSALRRAEMTPEQVEDLRAKSRARRARRLDQMSGEERERYLAEARAYSRAYYEANKEAVKAKARKRGNEAYARRKAAKAAAQREEDCS